MSGAAVIAGAKVGIDAARKVAKATRDAVMAARKKIAQEELDAGKDLDGDGVVGGVGNGA